MKKLLLLLSCFIFLSSTFDLYGQYKSRSDFYSDKAYGDYVKSTLKEGMRVEAIEDYYVIDKGDHGTYFGTNGGNPPCLVQWDDYLGKKPTLMQGFPEDKQPYAYWMEWHHLKILGGQSQGTGVIASGSIRKTFRAQDEETYSFSVPYSASNLSNARLVLSGKDYDYDNDGDYTDFTLTLNGTKLIETETLNSLGMPESTVGDITLNIGSAIRKGSNTLVIKETETSGQVDYAYLQEFKVYAGGRAAPATASAESAKTISINKKFDAQTQANYNFYISSPANLSNAKLALYGTDYDYDNDGDYTDFEVKVNGTTLISTKPLQTEGMPGSGRGNAEFDISNAIRHGQNTLTLKNTETSGQVDYTYLVHAKIHTGSGQAPSTASSKIASHSGALEEVAYLQPLRKKFEAGDQSSYSFRYYPRVSMKNAWIALNGSDYDHDNDGDFTDFTISLNDNDLINIEQLQANGMGANGNYGTAAWEVTDYLTSGSNTLTIHQTEDKGQVDYAYLKSASLILESKKKHSHGNIVKKIANPDIRKGPKDLRISDVVLTNQYTIITVENTGSANLCAGTGLYLEAKGFSRHYEIKQAENVPFCRGASFRSPDEFTLYFKGVPSSASEIDLIAEDKTGGMQSFYGIDLTSSGTGTVANVQKSSSKAKNFTSNMPPILRIEDITFSESVLNARETAQLSVTLKNVGPGDARDVYLNISGYQQGLEYPSKVGFPTIPSNGGTKKVTTNVKGGIDLASGVTTLTLEVVEPHFKVKIKGKQLKFTTKKLRSPELILAKNAVVEYQSANPNNQIDINEMIELKFVVQNVGQGAAEDVQLTIDNNQSGVMLLGAVQGNQLKREDPSFEAIPSGNYKTVVYRYFVNSEFSGNQLKFTINSSESIGRYGFSETRSFPINTKLEEEGFIRQVASKEKETGPQQVVVEDLPDLVVDVDTDIPSTDARQGSTYALIIGNEDYKSRQQGLTEEQNVDYAVNDAQVFAQYCNRTLGIPQKQIKLLKNATAAEIHQGLSWISNLAKIEEGNAKLIFYYSGHGLPDEQSKEPYLIPVDVSGKTIQYAVKLEEVYEKLTAHPTRQTTVFLDACFSGGGREEGLLAVKGVRIKPKSTNINDRVVAFASSTGQESSSVYREKHHGYFTYFLLKKLKQSKGSASYGELSDYIIRNVRKETGLISKIQTPKVNVSPEVRNQWKSWTLR